jgi:hypothetical protein
MKIKSVFSQFNWQPILALPVMALGCTFINELSAQSFVGKWNAVSMKNYYSAEFAKNVGKSEEEMMDIIGQSIVEIKADHTFTINFKSPKDPKITTLKGTWKLTGDQYESTIEPAYNPDHLTEKGTILITGNSMVTTAIHAPPADIIKVITKYTRM